LVAASTAVARQAGDAVLARTLAGCLVARLVQRAHRVTVTSCTNRAEFYLYLFIYLYLHNTVYNTHQQLDSKVTK